MAAGSLELIRLVAKVKALEAAQATSAWWSVAANEATVVGTVLALAGVSVALFTYVGTAATARLSHMHTMFKGYLELEFEYRTQAPYYPEDRLTTSRRYRMRDVLGSYKMYVLEEMYLWLGREKRMNVLYVLPWTHTRKHLRGWEKTLEWHLKRCSIIDRDRFNEAKDCYGPSFQEEARKAWEDESLPRESLP